MKMLWVTVLKENEHNIKHY